MDTRVLEYFLMVAREENITKAAALLHVTQPTLSRQLMQLEEELGAKLFDRTGHSVALTEEGISFRIRARDIVACAEKAKSEIVTNEDTLTGTVSIGCVELQSVRELSGWIVSFQRQYPKVKFELYSGSNEDIQERIEQGSLELGLFLLPFNLSRYATVQMRTRERWGVLVHQESPFAENRVIHPGELVGTPVVTIHVNTPAHQELIRWSGEYAKLMDFSINYNVLYNAVITAREQKGVVICLEPACHYDEMKFIPFEPEIQVGSALAWRKERRHPKAVVAFIRYVQEQYGEEANMQKMN